MEYLNDMSDYFLPLEESEFYHIFNRGNNSELLFFEQRNYLYFLQRLNAYLSDYLDLYTYCLLPNHFHLLVRIKNFKDLADNLQTLKKGREILEKPHEIISEQFRRFFISYSKSVIKQEQRTGSLFAKNFKRIKINSSSYFTSVINYIHRNPQTHHLTNDYRTYPYSSFSSLLSEKPTKLKRKEVLEWFGGKDHFIQFHEGNPVLKEVGHLLLE